MKETKKNEVSLKEKGVLKKNSFMNVNSSPNLLTLKNNKNFCSKFFEQHKITTLTDELQEADESRSLTYDFSRSYNFEAEAFNKIIDILMQLRAANDDQNIFVQNNTVLRENILNQLKNEVLRVSHKLSKEQIKNLEVISSNSFDEKALTEILNSFLKNSKKKFTDSEIAAGDFHVIGKSKYITLEKASKNYLTVLDKVSYYEKVLNRVLENISYDKFVDKKEQSAPKISNKENSELENRTQKRNVKEVLSKISKIQDVKTLEEVNKFYEENIVNKMGLLPRVIKLQSKISEMNILTKVGTFVENIVQKSVPKFVTSETELINKVINKSKIEELREDIVAKEQQYLEERDYQQRNINRVYNEVRKLYSAKNLSKNITEILKNTSLKKLNLEENVKKNLLKLTTKKDIVNRFKNVYDYAVENISADKVTDKTELINRTYTQEINTEEKEALKDVVNLRKSGVLTNKKFIENTYQNNILMKDINVRKRNIENVHKNLEKINNTFYEDENLRDTVLSTELINKEHLTKSDIQNYFEKSKDVYLDKIEKNLTKNKHYSIKENLKSLLTENITSIYEKEIYDKYKIISDKKRLNFFKHTGIKPIITIQKPGNEKIEVWDKEDIYRFKPVYIKENVLDEDKVENIVSKNITNVLSPEIMRSKSFKIHQKDVYKDLTKHHLEKYLEHSYNFKKEYLIKERNILENESAYEHLNHDYLIYKEKEKPVTSKEKSERIITKQGEIKKPNPKTNIYKKPTEFSVDDTQKIEKNILAKTMSKKDIVNLIESYMNNINVDAISETVIGRFESKMKFDRHRNGIF